MSIKNNKKANVRDKRTTLLDENVPFQVVESFKTLRSNIMFALSTRTSKVIAVSSALASEGKSTNAANLAITLAQTDSKVLFVDADLRKPVQHRIFKLNNKSGLSTLLSGQESFKEVLNSQVVPNLDIVTSGPLPPNPSEMLASENMKVLLDELARYYDYIILDTPPINVVSDTLNLLRYTAGVVMVVRQNGTPRDDFEHALNAIDFVEGHVLGVVLTRVNSRSGKSGRISYHGGKYGNYYSHGYGKKSSDTVNSTGK